MLSCILAAALAASLASSAAAAAEEARGIEDMDRMTKAPGVTSEMCSASFWLRKKDGVDEIIMTEDEIAEFNRKILEDEDTAHLRPVRVRRNVRRRGHR